MRCLCPYERVDFREGGGVCCCNYPCCPSDSISDGLELVTLKDGDKQKNGSPCCCQRSPYLNTQARMIVSGYAPLNLPSLPVTCFAVIIPFLPCMLLMNMNVWAWEFDLENSEFGTALVMYERRKGICCEERHMLIDCVTKVAVEEVTDEYIQSRLLVKGANSQIYRAPVTDFVEFGELETLANTLNNIIPPYFPRPVSRQPSQHREKTNQQTPPATPMQSYQPYQQQLFPSEGSGKGNKQSSVSALLNTLTPDKKKNVSHMLRLSPSHSISIVMPSADDGSFHSDAVLLQTPDLPNVLKPSNSRHSTGSAHFSGVPFYSTPDVIVDLTKRMPLKEVVDLIRKKYDIGQNLAMAAVLTHANIQLGLQSTGSLRDDAFRIAKRLDLIDLDDVK